MASAQRVDIHELQREMMASDLREEKARTVAANTTSARRRKACNGSHTLPHHFDGGRGGGEANDKAPAAFYQTGGQSLDIREILKHEALMPPAPPYCDESSERGTSFPKPAYGVSDLYILLDSFEKLEKSQGGEGEFRFNFTAQGETGDQSIGVKDRLDAVIGIQVCAFSIPLLPFDTFDPQALSTFNPGLAALQLAANGPLPTRGSQVSNPQSQTPFSGRVTMFLKEIGLQSYSDADNRRHHFEFDATVVGPNQDGFPQLLGDRILLTPLYDCDYFLFTDPIQDVRSLTVCFYNPGNFLRFPPDCLDGTIASTDAEQRLQFTYNDQTNLINLAVGDRIYFRNFQAVDPATGQAYPVLNSYVARPEGHLVGVGGFAVTLPTGPNSGTTASFRLNPDISTAGLSPPIPANTTIRSTKRIRVCIAKNRVRIPLRFRRIVGRRTNYVAP
ncbi:BA71V-H240R (J7R) protein [Elysia marginata]|uniref:BA71V-H240R (J7R) protein n=1 Tax=Elysia marginata TaxID=1093978 RepID=A0AAV4H2K9_9GAST|nr:BA71V-H240R (J7R) protein [Elysia marginata]